MNWFYWDTAWSLFFSLIWFMTITRNPDARIVDAHLRDHAPAAEKSPAPRCDGTFPSG